MLVSPEHRFVLHKIWEEKCLKQAEPFLIWLKVACTTVELPVRKQPKGFVVAYWRWPLARIKPQKVLFIKEVRTHLGDIHFTSEGGGGVGWVICCRHDFFEKVGFPLYIQL